MLLAAAAVPSSGSTYNVVWILIGVLTLFGSGGAFGLYKAAKRQGVRDKQLEDVIKVVLPDDEGKGGLTNRLDAQDRKLDAIQREAKPNGGNTHRLGDIAMRTETKVDTLGSKLDQHIGQSNEIHNELKRRLAAVERGS